MCKADREMIVELEQRASAAEAVVERMRGALEKIADSAHLTRADCWDLARATLASPSPQPSGDSEKK